VHLDDKESDEKKAEKWDEYLGPNCSWMKNRRMETRGVE
jgi:hypothetical protein